MRDNLRCLRAYMSLELRADLRPERENWKAKLRPERTDFRLERENLRPYRA